MSLKILHVLSSSFYAGSVVYAVKVAEKQAEEGCQVIIVSDKSNLSSKLHCIELPVSNRKAIQRIRNINAIRSIINEYHINVVHAHSRAASWICYYAVKYTKIPLVSTIHGRQVKKHLNSKMDIYGEKIIVICPNLYNHLINEIKINSEKLVRIPNGIDIKELNSIHRNRNNDEEKLISVIGRFNGPKGENLAKFFTYIFPSLLEDFPKAKIRLCGSEWNSLSEESKKAFDSLELKFRDRVNNFGFKNEIFQDMADSDLVIGAGRVALESTMLKVPVYAVGEACVHGFLTPVNINQAIASNFGDILPQKSDFKFDPVKILKEIGAFLSKPSPQTDLSIYLFEYNIDKVVSKIMDVYRSVIIKKVYPHFIPVLMYHKVPINSINTKHRTFVTKENFEKHLWFYRLRGLTSITFKEYYAYSNGDLPIDKFPKKPFIISFDDGYADNCENALPLIQKYGFKGVLFLLGDFSARSNFWDKNEDKYSNKLMNIEQKQAFIKAGWEIGAHTLSHCDLTKLSFEKAFIEISKSKLFIEETLKTDVYSFAYPYGIYNDEIKSFVEQGGYRYGIATDTGGLTIEDDYFAIFRINMFPEENIFQLYKKTSKWYRKYYRKKRGK